MNKLHRGFTLIETLLVILIAAVIGFGGYYVWHTHYKAKPATTNSKKAATVAPKPANSQKYLVITEWGVKLPLSSSINDAYYVASTSSQDSKGQPNIMWLGVTSLDSEPGCDAHTANQGRDVSIGSLTKTGPGEIDPRTGETFDINQPHGVKVGSSYYAVLLAQAMCNQDPKNDALLTAVRTAFTQAGQNIVQE